MMPASTLLSPQLWAEATFGSVQLGDPRRNRRAGAIAQALARETAASLPKQLHDGAALQATYRFLHAGQVRYEDLMRPLVEATWQDCREQAEVLLIQDTTEVDYQHHPKTRVVIGVKVRRNQPQCSNFGTKLRTEQNF